MKSIAVLGSGIAGLSAAWLLNQNHDVYVFEKQNRIGGHSNTVETFSHNGSQPVDTGFIVFNEPNYPNLVALFDHLNVQTKPSDMSFAVSLRKGQIEFGSRNLNAIFGQRTNLFSPRFWRMIINIKRFYSEAPNVLKSPEFFRDKTLGQYLAENRYSAPFIQDFILPMGAAIWSTQADKMRDYPVEAFIRFFSSHGLLQFEKSITWRTVCGGSRQYLQALTAAFKNPIQIGNGATKVFREGKYVYLIDNNGNRRKFDALIFATHADEALELLKDADPFEKKILSKFRYVKNRALLHSDRALMPKRQRIWSSWNYMGSAETGPRVTYWMNSLQSIDPKTPLFLSINPKKEPSLKSVIHDLIYSHPVFDLDALNAQESLWQIQGRSNCWFCGSYFGHGFHEDALQSGLAVAEELGAMQRPWNIEDESSRIYRRPAAREGVSL